MRIREMITRFNERLAVFITNIFGTMGMFYVCALYGLLPLIPAISGYYDKLLYWSNYVQLWALPILMVGQVIIGRSAETRDNEDHLHLTEMNQFLHDQVAALTKDINDLKLVLSELTGKDLETRTPPKISLMSMHVHKERFGEQSNPTNDD